ncbi:WW domain-containing oxidoreductase [Chaetomium fimeti]|uniref:WW domain-containing oxidoreductase n=1 Tax=Chaetomium fimeti TaxID=1854472 RepID=A0AAE0LT77_9PEZI|nr:WW domain-containing oxidoreductase [Chaetomium fimeti]
MTSPAPRPQVSIIWSAMKALKGTYSAHVTVPAADLRGKWVLITGSNNGIGREAAIQLARSGASLVLACRQPPPYETHPEAVVEECRAASGERGEDPVEVEWWECDMADMTSVEALAERWIKTGRPLDILVNNAGMAPGLGQVVLTKDGFEMCHQVNFLSHTLLTLSLLPSISKASRPRILFTTSCTHYLGKYDLSNANAGGTAYANNKLYLQIWLTELQLRLLQHPDYSHIVVHGLHPGYVKTGIWRPLQEASGAARRADPFTWLLMSLLDWFGIDSRQGSLAIVNAATSSELGLKADGTDEFRGGAKYMNRIWEDEASPYTRDSSSRKEVWDFIVGELDVEQRSGISHEIRHVMLA